MTLSTLTFGCRLNAAETAAMQACATEAGLDNAILVNTCAVTAEAVRQARQAIRRARREHPERRIVVSGCAAQTEPKTFAAMPEVDLVLGNAEKLEAASYRTLRRGGVLAAHNSKKAVREDAHPPSGSGIVAHDKILVGDIMRLRETASHMAEGFSAADRYGVRAFVQVQNGCDHRCTFCIIPYGRGPSRSVPMGVVVEEIKKLVSAGTPEIVLTGVDITAYGADLPGSPRLGTLMRTILRHVPELKRLRLSSIDSVEADRDLYRALAEEERLMPHLHLSLQSGDDLILKRMKRRHSRADAIRFCAEARRLRPDIVFGADLIAGFPTETDAMFSNSLSLVEECGLTFLHVFPFSPRAGTPAGRMPQSAPDVIRSRARTMRQSAHRTLSAFLSSEVGKVRNVLAEWPGIGRTEHYASVAIEDSHPPGSILSARIAASDGKRLSALNIRAAA